VQYSPFTKPLVDPQGRRRKGSPSLGCKPSILPPEVAHTLFVVGKLRHHEGSAAAMASVRPPSVDSNFSDWTDCDTEEFSSMAVCSISLGKDLLVQTT
jgi:hypothetical protein